MICSRKLYCSFERARRYTGASLTVLALATIYPVPASAENECGAAVDGVATCDDTGGNPYEDAIRYYTSSGLHLDVKSGIVVDRVDSEGEYPDGILLSGTGDDLLLMTIANGVTIKTYRPQDDAMQAEVRGSGNSDIRIVAGANVQISFEDETGLSTSAMFARNDVETSTGSIEVTQLSGSSFELHGEQVGGIEAYTAGLGDISVTSSGSIVGDGYYGFGIYVWRMNSAAEGAITITQSAEGTIDYTGDRADGIYAYTPGLGAVSLNVNGQVTVSGEDVDGTYAESSSESSAATVSHHIGRTASVTVHSDSARGVTTIADGLGATITTIGGSVATTGDEANGVIVTAGNEANDEVHVVDVYGQASISTTGERSHGVTANIAGTGTLDIDVRDESKVDVEGDDSFAILASAAVGGDVSVTVGKGAALSASGSNGRGVSAQGFSAGDVAVDGTVVASGANAAAVDLQVSEGEAIATVGSTGVLTASGANGRGIAVRGHDAAEVDVDGAVTANGLDGVAIDALAFGGRVDVSVGEGGVITASGENGRGIVAGSVDSTNVNVDGAVIANGANGFGIKASSEAGPVHIVIGAGTALVPSDVDVRRVAAADEAVEGSVEAIGEYGVAVEAIASTGNASVTIGSSSSVAGGWQEDVASLSVVTSRPAAAIVIGSDTGSLISNAGTISAGSDRAIYDIARDDGPGAALAVENSGTITGFVQFAGVADNQFDNLTGGVFHARHFADTDGDGTRDTRRVSVSDFGEDSSVFTNAGTVRVGGSASPAATDAAGFYVPTTGAGSRALEASYYNLGRTEQAQFVKLGRFEHSGLIDLRGAAPGNTLVITSNPTAGGPAGDAVFVANGGELRLSAVLNGGIPLGGQSGSYADMLIVDRTELGSAPTRIVVEYGTANGAYTPGNGIQLVEVRDKSASAAGVFALGNTVAGGAYEYHLHHNGVAADSADGNWYLRSTVTDPDTGAEVPSYRPEVPVITSPQVIAARFGLDTLGTYHDRQGEDYADWLPREASQPGLPENGHSGRANATWGRIYGVDGNVGYKRRGMTQQAVNFQKYGPALDYDTFGFQLGFDILRDTGSNGGRNVAGIYGGYGETDADVDAIYGGEAGSLKLDGYNIGLYFTHKSRGGTYVDAVVQGSRYKAMLRTDNGAFAKTDGWGFAASLEAGTPLALGGGWRLEPQAQLVYQRVRLDDVADDLTLVDYRKVEALWGRLGARLGKSWTRSSGLSNMAWLRFNVWHDFDNDAEAGLSNLAGDNVTAFDASLGGTWGQAQLALSSELARNVSGFVSGDYNFSLDKMNSDAIGGRVGLRFTW